VIEVRKPMFYALASAGLPLVGLESAQANLEDVFISIIDSNKKEDLL
jgi:hypothetical protein